MKGHILKIYINRRWRLVRSRCQPRTLCWEHFQTRYGLSENHWVSLAHWTTIQFQRVCSIDSNYKGNLGITGSHRDEQKKEKHHLVNYPLLNRKIRLNQDLVQADTVFCFLFAFFLFKSYKCLTWVCLIRLLKFISPT